MNENKIIPNKMRNIVIANIMYNLDQKLNKYKILLQQLQYLHKSINLTTVKRLTKESIKVAFFTTLWKALL